MIVYGRQQVADLAMILPGKNSGRYRENGCSADPVRRVN
jgi:hypothetical protein